MSRTAVSHEERNHVAGIAMLIPTGGSKDRETCKLTHFNTTVAMWRASALPENS
jgi:hypothetical protein